MEMQKTLGPHTLRGTYNEMKRNNTVVPFPPLKRLARSIIKQGLRVWDKALVEDAERWLTAKSGGTPAERKARADRRKEQKARNYASKLARRSKGRLKPSAEGGGNEKKGKGK